MLPCTGQKYFNSCNNKGTSAFQYLQFYLQVNDKTVKSFEKITVK